MAYDKALVEKASAQTGVPADLLERVISEESSGNPGAVSYRGSRFGEGLTQLSEGTARDEGVSDRFDPEQSIVGGAKYLKAMYDQFGSWPLAAAAYVSGPETVKKAGGVPSSAKSYVEKVTGTMATTTPSATSATDAATDKELARTMGEEKANLGEYEKLLPEIHAADSELVKHYDQLSDEYHSTLTDLDKLESMRPKPPGEEKLPQYKPPQVKEPFKVMMQMMPLMLLAGSKAGRNKGLALMKMTAASLKGAKQGNDDVRQQAHEDWKASLDGAIEQAKLDHEHYMDILSDNNATMSERLHRLEVFAAISQNDQLRAAAQTGDLKAVTDREAMLRGYLGNLLQIKANTLQSERQQTEMQYNQERLGLEQQRLDETKRYHEEQTPFKRMAAAEKLRNDVDKSPLGKAYASLDQYSHVIEQTASDLAAGKDPKSMQQGAFLDAYTKIITGGQAIRGFTLRLNMEHAGLADRAERYMNMLKGGGPLSKRQMADAIDVVHKYSAALSGEYQQTIARADDFAKQSGVITDDQTVAPFSVDPAKLAGAAAPATHKVGDIIHVGGKAYRVTGGNPADPDVEEVH